MIRIAGIECAGYKHIQIEDAETAHIQSIEGPNRLRGRPNRIKAMRNKQALSSRLSKTVLVGKSSLSIRVITVVDSERNRVVTRLAARGSGDHSERMGESCHGRTPAACDSG